MPLWMGARRRGWLGDWLGSDLGEGSGCAEGTDVDGWLEAAFKERDVVIEAEGAARRFVGHGDTVVGGVSGPPTLGSNALFVGVGLIHGREGVSPNPPRAQDYFRFTYTPSSRLSVLAADSSWLA